LFFFPYLAESLGHFEFKTLLTSSGAFCKSWNFSVPGNPTGLLCGVGASKSFFGTKISALCKKKSHHHASGWISMSSTKVFSQEACAQYHTLE
jgi:hypothetical protein